MVASSAAVVEVVVSGVVEVVVRGVVEVVVRAVVLVVSASSVRVELARNGRSVPSDKNSRHGSEKPCAGS